MVGKVAVARQDQARRPRTSPSARARRGAPSRARPPTRISHGLRHILVVEDESPIRLMLADLLADAGYAVAEAIDGFQALEHLRERRPDLIVLDLMLPGMSGWEFLDRSRAQLEQENVPVIIMSAIKGTGDYPATLGVAAWFTKPLDAEHFLRSVEQLAGPSHARPVADAARPASGGAVLVVEDQPKIGALITEHLEQEGYQVDVVPTVEQALARVEQATPRLILLDLTLPGRSGFDFLRQRQHDARLGAIPVLVVSGAPHKRLIEAKRLGAEGFLSKPFDFDVLTALMHSYID